MKQLEPSITSRPALAPPIERYLDAIVGACGMPAGPLVSLVLFGSASTGAYVPSTSDVDLLLVLRDDVTDEAHAKVQIVVADLELRHGLARPAHTGSATTRKFMTLVGAEVRTFFVCTRADLLSGEPRRILGLPALQAAFVDRIAIPSILASGRTVWGEELLHAVPSPPVRRLDVAKAFVGLFGQGLLASACYPFLPAATKLAMDALKRSVHSCYFCHRGHAAPLDEEIDFLRARYDSESTLARLLALRANYRPSFAFVAGCLPELARMHWRTGRNLRFPRPPWDGTGDEAR